MLSVIGERNRAEKREYDILARVNALETRLKKCDELLQEEFALRQGLALRLMEIGDYAHDKSTGGPAVEDALWEIRRMVYDL